MDEPSRISGHIVDVPSRRIYPGTLLLDGGRIADIVPGGDVPECYILPGFVDAHVHIESSLLPPCEFARMAVAHGTVAAVCDPHEIANVLGLAGVEYMLADAARAPFHFAFGAPSCVPATACETAGASLNAREVASLLARPDIRFLSEMMNYPGVLGGDPEVMAKLNAARRFGKPVDGHAPGLRGDDLRRYIAAGITTDHESLSSEEAAEKIGLGMKVLIREGSAARGFDEMADLIGQHPGRVMLCSDDKHPDELVQGHINGLVRRAVAGGLDLMDVLEAACVVPVRHYGLDVGLLQPGDPADFIVVGDLQDFSEPDTYVRGQQVAAHGMSLLEHRSAEAPNAFAARQCDPDDFRVPAQGPLLRVIGARDGALVTDSLLMPPTVVDGCAVADPARDLLKIAVVNRYQPAPPAVGFVAGFGLRCGAIAGSVAHDSHNVIAVGSSDQALCEAANTIIHMQGGLVVVRPQGPPLRLPLPIAGLMSAYQGEQTARDYSALKRAASDLGSALSDPFMTLSFMALLVIPALKLSDRGLFDGARFAFTPLFAEA